jgi:hypothetical protein
MATPNPDESEVTISGILTEMAQLPAIWPDAMVST